MRWSVQFIRSQMRFNMSRGASLLDTLVGSAIFLTIMLGFFGVLQLSIREATDSKGRAGAVMLANESLEYARGLAYADVGVSGGFPNGILVSPEQLALNDITYTRSILVSFVDDPKDGTGGSDSNGNTHDYKKIEIAVSWMAHSVWRTVSLNTIIIPVGIES